VPRRDCARAASAQTREFAVVRLVSDHLRRPRGAHEPFRARTPTRKLDRFAAGAQIITRDSPRIDAARAEHVFTTCFGIRNVRLGHNS
jgi:hypothetical protein